MRNKKINSKKNFITIVVFLKMKKTAKTVIIHNPFNRLKIQMHNVSLWIKRENVFEAERKILKKC